MIKNNIHHLIISKLKENNSVLNIVTDVFLHSYHIKKYPVILVNLLKRENIAAHDYHITKDTLSIIMYSLSQQECSKLAELISLSLHQLTSSQASEINFINQKDTYISQLKNQQLWKGKMIVKVTNATRNL